ncbi:class I lanthipeptide [Flavobacterium cerinum]|uniref:Class I lanthipeptide n=1 Tax=Flavobacterium cerinum TaxID=2502784 RepID=A0ABY5IU60_9FLAO|nr:class I lanthipeptide [Flavobacterium cerinum]UUC46199.1 class I lanthipeptide [Flavobacterium cerinum]
MKTQNTNKLTFSKNALAELNDNQLNEVQGGSSAVLTGTIAISVAMAIYYEWI